MREPSLLPMMTADVQVQHFNAKTALYIDMHLQDRDRSIKWGDYLRVNTDKSTAGTYIQCVCVLMFFECVSLLVRGILVHLVPKYCAIEAMQEATTFGAFGIPARVDQLW